MNRIFLKSLCLGIVLFASLANAGMPDWIDRSSSIFFPAALKDPITVNQTFPLFWWNFLVLDHPQALDWERAKKLCAALKKLEKDLITRAECKPTLEELKDTVNDWAEDYLIRSPKPETRVIQKSMSEVLAKATMPTGDGTLLSIFRKDPFESWKELKALAERKMPLKLQRQNGFFVDEATRRIVIPIQFSYSPTFTARTKVFIDQILDGATDQYSFIGPHSSTFQNETQIKADTGKVSLIGIFVLLASIALLVAVKRWKMIFLFPVVFLGTGIAGIITICVFGSIHGLTLSFGTGIIGLALDYGFQSAFNTRNPHIWKSNFCGLCTTVIGLVVLMFSSVPLLRQMMFFAAVGICVSFLLFYLLAKIRTDLFAANSFSENTIQTLSAYKPWKIIVSLTFILASFVGLFTIKPNLDMQQFNFQGDQAKKVESWLLSSSGLRPPLFEMHPESEISKTYIEKDWATEHQIGIENLANYFPLISVQQSNLNSWVLGWPDFENRLSITEKKFFEPFLLSHHLTLPGLSRKYLSHLYNSSEPENRKWITLWLPKTDSEEHAIKTQFPQVASLREIAALFPRVLAHELAWMTPISLILATLVHLVYYRRIDYALIALIPFFAGMGLLTLAQGVFRFDISFISVMGMVMVFGFSLDYGVFATDACIHRESSRGFWSGILFAATATIAGFVPLLFCVHPVLKHLGITLFFGSVGTLIGALFGIPSAMYFFDSFRKKVENK